jgi:hypothetical protein
MAHQFPVTTRFFKGLLRFPRFQPNCDFTLTFSHFASLLLGRVWLTRRAFEGGAGSTLECLFFAYAGPCRDVGPAGSVIPVAVNPVRPSPPLPHHAGHCDDIPTLLARAGTRRRHNGYCATYAPPLPSAAPSNRPTTTASQPTATPPPSKPLLYEHRTHLDASTGAGFARTAVSSAALLAIPPHVGK